MKTGPLHRHVPEAGAEAQAILDPARGAIEAPIRGPIFGAARFREHGTSLAQTHAARVMSARAATFFPRLRENLSVLREAHRYIGLQEHAGYHVSPAGEWLLDNFHVVQAQLKEIHEGLPRRYFRDLPILVDAHLAGLPRVYGIAWAFVAHTDSAFDDSLLLEFLAAYQERRELTLGELWALPTTLRVVLVENLRRLSERVATTKAARRVADQWCDALGQGKAADPDALLALMKARGVERPFALQVLQRLESGIGRQLAEGSLDIAPIRAAIERVLPDPDTALAQQQAQQAADNLSVSNAITSLRQLGDADWRSLIAHSSALVRLMQTSPIFCAERDDTQDATLHAIEKLARRSAKSELDVARTLLGLMDTADTAATAARLAPTYWLRGSGRKALRRALGLRAVAPYEWHAMRLRFAQPAYLVTIAIGTALVLAWLIDRHVGADATLAWVALIAVLALWPASETVIAIVNRLISESVPPRRLPRLALNDGIPADHRTLVVVPTMLTDLPALQTLVRQLEKHYLANPERHAQFALLTDFKDAPAATLEGDAMLLGAAVAAIDALEDRYGDPAPAQRRFLLLHRRRVWSATEGCWIGWERKRGKLEQLIRMLAAGGASPFVDLGARAQPAPGTRYVVTLDSDTEMPPGTLRELVGVAAHPLNHPRVDAARRRVVAGYGILQPHLVTPLPPAGQSTAFHWLFAGQTGIDPYSAATSEVYQDLFAEGSFTGKGLLHVGAMHAVLSDRLPQDQVLSHDLLEGSLARCGRVGDVASIEDAPMHADVAASRVHRWTRGDWQLLPLLLRPGRYALELINRWKMLDNLRRSLVAPFSVALLLVALAGGPLSPWAALLLVMAAFGSGSLLGAIAAFAPSRDNVALRHFYRSALLEVFRAAGGVAWNLAQLLRNAMLLADAIGRAVYRTAVSRRHLLQWTTAAAAQAAAAQELPQVVRRHLHVSLVALLLLIGLLAAGTPWVALSVALCLLWAASPLWTWWASRPRTPRRDELPAPERDYLLDVARDTWRLFERYVGVDGHHLPPDNVQMVPHLTVAYRTSPTNIGLYLLAAVCAHRFGWLGILDLLDRLEQTLCTLARLARHRGHFLNWYDTKTLRPLPPAYVSTVDSGNLCALLIAVANACEQFAEAPDERAAARAALARARSRALSALHADGLDAANAVPGAIAELLALADEPGVSTRDDERLLSLLEQATEELRSGVAAETSRGGDAAGPSAASVALLRDYVATVSSIQRDRHAIADEVQQRLLYVGRCCRRLAEEADFSFLFDRRRRLLHIGMRVEEQQLDRSFYDLLASEARLASLWAISTSDVPVAHWAALGRPFFATRGDVGLRSWSGSMFEYLMPPLLLDEPPGSALGHAQLAAVNEQIAFGQSHRLVWGMSESAYAARDHTLAYQYGPQGVPRLALRRTSPDDIVVAPYATALAAMVAPRAALQNLKRLEKAHARGALGFVEALDFSPERQTDAGGHTLVSTFMAHHQGMTIVAVANVLLDAAPRRWTMSEPRISAAASLLQERTPREVSRLLEPPPRATRADRREIAPAIAREVVPGAVTLPPTHLLSNGSYSVALRANGAGWSRFGAADVSRWRDDALRDRYGSFVYLRRTPAAVPVSLTQHPAPDPAARYSATFHRDRVCFDAHWQELRTRCTVWVSPEDDIELRRIELRNESPAALELELSSMFEVALSDARADEMHPAFANLFVTADWDAIDQALYLARKPRRPGETGLHAVHFVAHAQDGLADSVRAHADRAQWLGRNRDAAHPLAPLHGGCIESGRLATGLDPIASLTLRLVLPPHASTQVTLATAAASERAALETLVDRYRRATLIERSSMMSATFTGIRLREMRIKSDDLGAIQTLTSLLAQLQPRPQAEPSDETIDRRALWRFGISGDRPLMVIEIGVTHGLRLLRSLVHALRLWSWGGLAIDLVIVNAEPKAYLMPLQTELLALQQRYAAEAARYGARGCGLHVLQAESLAAAERSALLLLARLHLSADARPLSQRVQELEAWHGAAAELLRAQRGSVLPLSAAPEPAQLPRGEFDQGSYRFHVSRRSRPPRPWINVLANERFGAQVSEAGAGFTWAGNSRMHQLTSWSNDPVSDPGSELYLLQDMATRKLWNIAAGPGCADVDYVVEHRQGATVIGHRTGQLEVKTTWSVDRAESIKRVRIVVSNHGGTAATLRFIGVLEWVLGAVRAERQSVRTSCEALADDADPARRLDALLATQRDGHSGFGGSTAFVALYRGDVRDARLQDWTCDRREFFDEAGRLIVPDRLGRLAGSGLDPCAACAAIVTIGPGASGECTFVVGHGPTPQAACALASRATLRRHEEAESSATAQWDELLGAIKVATPDPLFDALVNRWLLYQALACRIWARAGFYQAGGAFGFRDQLQDAMALAIAAPDLLRRQLLLAASRQFVEGDVQHWWHPPTGAGVRTRISDDLLWLPFAASHYVQVTGDAAILDESVSFIDGDAVPPGAEDAYYVPQVSSAAASLYEHCARTIERSLAVGVHGLPLMGSGDWNDGMNCVGHEGRGESVWLGWFLCRVMDDFMPLAAQRDDNTRVARWQEAAHELKAALRTAAWDGEWFVRAFFDDGSALGSQRNEECRIDLIAQAWAVLSQAALPEQQREAMNAALRLLADREHGLIRLLDPPLENAVPSAGYIQAYPPGVRENGGQYSHAGVWAVMAQAALGDADGAYRSFTWLSPAHRCADPQRAARYELEPYVMAGDVYTQAPYAGRGGWSWYTGSAAWMYRAAIETICGLRVRADRFCLLPRLPSHWPSITLTLRLAGGVHRITVCAASAEEEIRRARSEGAAPLHAGEWVAAADGGATHHLLIHGASHDQPDRALPEPSQPADAFAGTQSPFDDLVR